MAYSHNAPVLQKKSNFTGGLDVWVAVNSSHGQLEIWIFVVRLTLGHCVTSMFYYLVCTWRLSGMQLISK